MTQNNHDEQSRLLSDHLKTLLSYSVVIVAITAITIGAGVAFWFYQPTAYTAEASVLVSPVSLQPGQALVTSEKLDDMATERRVAASWPVALGAVENLASDGHDFDVEGFHKNLHVNLENDTRVLGFTYTSSTPQRAALAVDAAAQSFVQYRSEQLIQQRDTLASVLSRSTSELQAELSDVVSEIAKSQNARELLTASNRLENAEAAADRARLESQRDSLQRQLDSSLSESTTLAMVGVDAARQLEVAEVPAEPDGLGIAPTVAGAGVGGLVIGVLFAYMLSAFNAGSQPAYSIQAQAPTLAQAPNTDTGAPRESVTVQIDAHQIQADRDVEATPPQPESESDESDRLPPLTWKPLDAPRRPIDFSAGSESAGSGQAEMPRVTGAEADLNAPSPDESKPAEPKPAEPKPAEPKPADISELSRTTQPVDAEELEAITDFGSKLEQSAQDELDDVQLAIRATLDPLHVPNLSKESESTFEHLVDDLGTDLGRHLELAQTAVASADFANTMNQLRQLGSNGPVTVAAIGDGLDDPALAVAFQLGVQLAGLGAKALVVDLVTTAPRLHRIADVDLAPGAGEILTGRVQLGTAITEVTGVPGLSILTRGGTAGAIEVGLDGSAVARMIGRARLDYHAVLLIGGCSERDTIPALASLSDAVLVGTEKPIGSAVDSELSQRLELLASPTLDVVSVAPLPPDDDEPVSALSPPMPKPADRLAKQPFISSEMPPLPPLSGSTEVDALVGSEFKRSKEFSETSGLDASS